MTNSRKRKFDNVSKSDSIGAETSLPLKARPISELVIDEAAAIPGNNAGQINNIAALFNYLETPRRRHANVRRAHKRNGDATYYFKTHTDPNLVQLEAYSASVCQLLASDGCVPDTRVYYEDDSKEIVGVASKELEGYQSLHDNPLLEDDISMAMFNTQHQKGVLLSCVDRLIAHSTVPAGSLLSRMGSMFASPTLASEFAANLSIYKNMEIRFSEPVLDDLVTLLSQRLTQLGINESDRSERSLINSAIKSVNLLKSSINNQPSCTLSVADFDEIDRQVKLKNIDLTKRKWVDARLDNRRVRINSSELAHYRTIKNLSVALTTRYIFKEGDNHALHNAKDGRMIDFDLTKQPLSLPLKTLDGLSEIVRRKNAGSLPCTAKDIRAFPDVSDAQFYYWPTVKTRVAPFFIQIISQYLKPNAFNQPGDAPAQAVAGKIRELKEFIVRMLVTAETTAIGRVILNNAVSQGVDERIVLLQQAIANLINEQSSNIELNEIAVWDALGRSDQLYTDNDNQLFKGLSFHPVFEYHMYKTFLKFLILDPEVYHCIAEFQISADAVIKLEDSSRMSLRTAAANDDIARHDEVAAVLATMPEFTDFISQFGDAALNEILGEVDHYKSKYTVKLEVKPQYQRLVNALDLDQVRERYDAICDSMNARSNFPGCR